MTDIFNNPYLNRIIYTFLILLLGILFSKLTTRSINLVFEKVRPKIVKKQVAAKTHTIKLVLGNVINVVILIVVILTIISQWGINIGPILTGAGILGLAITLGSQALIKDLISGFFIIAENQFNIGEKIRIGNYEGFVYRMTLRLTVLKDSKGNLIYIPNSQISIIVRIKEEQPIKRI
jgi:moderate conductance mechanosensitive channel